MKHNNRGSETKESILRAGRSLFYEHGYKATTARMIAGQANINLGLIDYYFKGKEEIATLIYRDVRNSFESLFLACEPQTTPLDMFFISSALELRLCLECLPFGRFYDEIILFPAIHQRLLTFNASRIKEYGAVGKDTDYPMLAAISIASIKPALVDHALHCGHALDTGKYLSYYLEQQLHYFGLHKEMAARYQALLSGYYVNAAANFTPILTKLL